jgi:hypothetical protein
VLPRLRHSREAVVLKVINFDKGSKRRLKQIRWTVGEVLSLTGFSLLMIAAIALALLWELHHEHPLSEPTKDHQIREAEPSRP